MPGEAPRKSIHDPLYGFVDLDDTEIRVIDSAAFRRLQRIKQLSQAHMVYPSANHTRFEHSVGVCHLAGVVARRLGFGAGDVGAIRMAGLLHDVGHGPFSHLFETVVDRANGRHVGHEAVSRAIIRNDPEISGILGGMAERVSCILNRRPVPGWDERDSTLAADVVSGPLDVDRMDYLRRDSHHLGVSYGRFDLEQLIHTVAHTRGPGGKRICIGMKGWGAAEEYRSGRYLMHAQVYQHHAILVANRMCLAAMEAAMDEGVLDPGLLRVDSPGFVDEYVKLDDQRVADTILHSGGTGAHIMGRLRRRDLLKRICEVYPDREVEDPASRLRMARMGPEDQRRMAAELARELRIPEYDIMVQTSHVPVNHNENQILVAWKGAPRGLDEFSPITSNHSPISKFYIFGRDGERVRRGVADYMESEFGLRPARRAGS